MHKTDKKERDLTINLYIIRKKGDKIMTIDRGRIIFLFFAIYSLSVLIISGALTIGTWVLCSYLKSLQLTA